MSDPGTTYRTREEIQRMRDPERAESGSGMSPMTMAILALLAYKAVKHISGSSSPSTTAPAPTPSPAPGGGLGGSLGGGGLGGLLGGLLAGGAAGSVLSGGLGDVLKQFQQKRPGGHRGIRPKGSAPAKDRSPMFVRP